MRVNFFSNLILYFVSTLFSLKGKNLELYMPFITKYYVLAKSEVFVVVLVWQRLFIRVQVGSSSSKMVEYELNMRISKYSLTP